MNPHLLTRRKFLRDGSIAVAAMAALGHVKVAPAAAAGGVSIVVPADDPVVTAAPVRWAIAQLQEAIQSHQVDVRIVPDLSAARQSDLVVIVAAAGTKGAQLDLAGRAVPPTAAESLVIVAGTVSGRAVLLACANDPRGAVYAVLELADRVLCSDSVQAALSIPASIIDQSVTKVRSVVRYFQSEIEDKPWFNDRAFWIEYLSMLASERFNRFHLSFGLGYDMGNPRLAVADAYLLFAYPFLVSVCGVSVTDLPDAERQKNLEILRFISDECAIRAIDFQLGLWTHTIEYTNAPKYRVKGLDVSNGSDAHAAYCRDALTQILMFCPNIRGVTFRVHVESGIARGNYKFWQTLFSAFTPFAQAGRVLEIDMHGKECTQEHIDAALASGARVVVSPKYCGEHQGLPYHPMSLEFPERSKEADPTKLDGQASRYGYSNFFKEDRPYGILHRVWPGTQRALLWGDPVFAAGYGRAANFCGSLGVELSEPLSFKGREGSGIAGGRCGYADATLTPKYDFEKFLYTYRLWGRLIFNPETDRQVWRRYLARQFGAAAQQPLEDALASASRILMMVTQFHGWKAANHSYWPEMYVNASIVKDQLGTSFDPQLFLDSEPFAQALLDGNAFALDKYLPSEFSQWVEDWAAAAMSNLAIAKARVANRSDPGFRRLEVDVAMQAGLGLFFARKFRSATLWYIHKKTGDANAKSAAVAMYKTGRDAWMEVVDLASVYMPNVSYGSESSQHGHWRDRVAGIDQDIADMASATPAATTRGAYNATTHPVAAVDAVKAALSRSVRGVLTCTHAPPANFIPGRALLLALSGTTAATTARLYYRHVNQAETWRSATMQFTESSHSGTIPADYMNGIYPVQYYFGLTTGNAGALFPGFDPTFSNQPNFVVRRALKSS